MAKIEKRMRDLGVLETKPKEPFLPESSKSDAQLFNRGYIQDDHVPFMACGVPILHIIPSHFPDVWHTMQDDGEHLDMPTVQDWAKIVAAFAAEWMDLGDYLPKTPAAGNGAKQKRGTNKTEL